MREWIQHPERVWVRKRLFYVHLWVGAGVGLYIVLMSITGSLIVYRNQLETTPSLVPAVEWIVDLHENLLFGDNGRFVNRIGATCVIVLCLTGAEVDVFWADAVSTNTPNMKHIAKSRAKTTRPISHVPSIVRSMCS